MSDPGAPDRDDDGIGTSSDPGVGLVIGSRTPSLERRAYDAVLHWLLEGGASPGEVVPVRELSRRLGISRTPVRFAVGRLHEQGLVDYDARIGFTVSLPSVAGLEELFGLQLMCEVHAVRRVFAHGGGTHRILGEALALEAREGSERAIEVATDPSLLAAFSDRDSRVHRLVVDHAASPGLGG
jgi:DNA-binding GntR family transcriptional regulator